MRSIVTASVVVLLLVLPGSRAEDKKPAVKTFTNSKEGLKGDKLKHYVDFSIEYPASWKVIEEESSNFIKVERGFKNADGQFTQENFAVGLFYTSGNAEKDKELFPKVYTQLKEQTKEGFPKCKFTSEGEKKFGEYPGYTFRFTSEFENPENKEKMQIYGCWHLLYPPAGGTKGVAICYLGTSKAPELKGIDDLGVKGELPIILKSFKFGKN